MTAVTDLNTTWIRRYRPCPESLVRLVCLPHAGGSSSFYLPVARALYPDVDVLAVQYPGRQDRRHEPMLDTVADLADMVTAALRPWLGQPLALFGHSMGATLAFEVAQRLTAAGNTDLVHLFASGRRAPGRHRDESFHRGDDDALLAEMKRLSGTDSRILGDEELIRMIMPAIRNDYRAAETYRFAGGPRLSVPISVLIGDADPKVDRAEAEAWAEHTTAPCDVHVFPGGHFYLADHQHEVLDVITDRLCGR